MRDYSLFSVLFEGLLLPLPLDEVSSSATLEAEEEFHIVLSSRDSWPLLGGLEMASAGSKGRVLVSWKAGVLEVEGVLAQALSGALYERFGT